MEHAVASTPTPSRLMRTCRGYLRVDVRRMRVFKVEDLALAGGYFAAFWLLDAVNFTGGREFHVAALASMWPALAVMGCIGVLFRRVSPTAMACLCSIAIVGLVLAGHDGAFLLTFELFFSLVFFGSAHASQLASKTAWVLTVLLIVLAFAMSGNAASAVAAGIISVVTLLTPVEWAGNLRKANQLTASESARANAVDDATQAHLLAERSTHELVLERERQHLARELHDVISARLSAIALQSGAALHAAQLASPASGEPAKGTMVLQQIRDESVAGLDELQTMIQLLHTGATSQASGQMSNLSALVQRHQAAGMALELNNAMDDDAHPLPLPIQTAVFRIASEALANAAKHSPGQRVSLSLKQERPTEGNCLGDVVLVVSNDLEERNSALPAGTGTGTGTGIPSMHFRAAHAGGSITAGPSAGLWTVALRIPLPSLTGFRS